MTTTNKEPKLHVGAETRAAVEQFYAKQVRHLDALNIPEFLETLAEDCSFSHGPGNELKGREAVLADAESRNADRPDQHMQHVFHTFELEPGGDCLHARFAATVFIQNSEGPALMGFYDVKDVLVEADQGFAVAARQIFPRRTGQNGE